MQREVLAHRSRQLLPEVEQNGLEHEGMVLHDVVETDGNLHQDFAGAQVALRSLSQLLRSRKIVWLRNDGGALASDETVAECFELGRICHTYRAAPRMCFTERSFGSVRSRERIAGGPGMTATGGSAAATSDSR